jgi:hypothetical protein
MRSYALASTCPEPKQRSDRNAGHSARSLEMRREEILALLDEIRGREPTSTDIAQVIAQASGGYLEGERLQVVAASVVASFKAK